MEALALPNTLCRAVDVCDAIGFEQAVQEAESEYGAVDCLINNAGVMLLSELDVQDPKEWQTMIDVNISGVLNGMKVVMAGMKQRRCGTIVNISSLAGQKVMNFTPHIAPLNMPFTVLPKRHDGNWHRIMSGSLKSHQGRQKQN